MVVGVRCRIDAKGGCKFLVALETKALVVALEGLAFRLRVDAGGETFDFLLAVLASTSDKLLSLTRLILFAGW